MKLCYVADANSIHTWRWIGPFIERGDQIFLISYTPVERSWRGLADLVDLTQLSNRRKVRFVRWGWWVSRYVRRIQPDILHAHQLTGAGWLGVMAQYRPFVISAWGSDILIEPQKSVFRRSLVRLVLRRCDRLTVPSQLMADAARALGVLDSQLRLVPWGLETDIFQPTPADRLATRSRFGFDERLKVVFCPRKVSSIYNIDVLIEAVRIVRTQIPDLCLVLLRFGADPDYVDRLEQVIDAYGMEDIVTWLPGQESAEAMARLYRMSDLVVSIPSSEGYGFSVYEAMAAGCPTLISDLPVFRNEFESGVHTLKVPVRDVPRTKQALLDLLTGQDLRQKLGRNALSVCREKSVEKRVEQALSLYREVVRTPDDA